MPFGLTTKAQFVLAWFLASLPSGFWQPMTVGGVVISHKLTRQKTYRKDKPNGAQAPTKEIEMTKSMGNLFDEHEEDLINLWESITPDQRLEQERKTQAQRDHEALHTPIETDEERANTDEYPDDDND
tara:strand:+ start:527 stop:910 length:384 start_codon:yes stop_codon:yes gene_type:complete